jgi:hypothetical protein
MFDDAIDEALAIPDTWDRIPHSLSTSPLLLSNWVSPTSMAFGGTLPPREKFSRIWSSNIPTPGGDLPDLFVLGLPPVDRVLCLAWDVRLQFGKGARSLAAVVPDISLPLWVIPFWNSIHEASSAQSMWTDAHTSFTQKVLPLRLTIPDPILSSIVSAVKRMFMVVGWRAPLGSNLTTLDLGQLFHDGFIDGRFTDAVARILNRSLHGTDIMVVTSDVQWALEQDDQWPTLETNHIFTHLRNVEAVIRAEGKRHILVPWNLNNLHWVFYVLALEPNTIRYGDGFLWRGAQPRAADLAHLQRWMSRITDKPTQVAALTALLDIGEQHDGCSCAIMMVMGMERFIDRTKPRWTQETARIRRVEWAVRLCIASGSYTYTDFGLPDGLYSLHAKGGGSDSTDSSSSSDDEVGPDGRELTDLVPEDLPPPSSPLPNHSSPDWTSVKGTSDVSDLEPGSPAAEETYFFTPGADQLDGVPPATKPSRDHLDLRAPPGPPQRGAIHAFFPRLSKVEAEQQRRANAENVRAETAERQEVLEFVETRNNALKEDKKKAQVRERKRRQREREREAKVAAVTNSGPVRAISSSASNL